MISREGLFEYRTKLRRAGYFFVPVNDDELAWHLNASIVKGGHVIETAELKAIRENILRVRMSEWLQLPLEVDWLDTTLKAFLKVLGGLWKDSGSLSEIRARSNWIIDQVDIRGWAHSLGAENAEYVIRLGRGLHILMMLIPLSEAPQEMKDAFWSWIEDGILGPIKEQFPSLYAWIVEWLRSHIEEIAKKELVAGSAI